MFEIDVNITMDDILHNLPNFSDLDKSQLKSELDIELGIPTLNHSDMTVENIEKLQYLIDNIWNINLTDLETIKK